MAISARYPVRVGAELDSGLSRWLWLVKWLLVVPHYVVLVFLWAAFVVLSVIAFFAILFTGRYPRSIFEFNVGVLRWSWRVAYYAYGALGTDRYPPFTLAEVPDYPARLEVLYPDSLSRGLVLVKWWLLAIPHYLVVGVFLGGGTWVATRTGGWVWAAGPGLIGVLVLVAAIALAFTGRYPRGVFDLVLGLNRWVLRVAAYAGLMTDAYPPFRLDLGGYEPGGTLTVPPPPPGALGPGSERTARTAHPSTTGWTGGRAFAVVVGALVTLAAIAMVAGGGAATWLDRTQRDVAGYLTSGSERLSTGTYALATEGIVVRVGPRDVAVGSEAGAWLDPADVLGRVRIRVTAADEERAIFVGIARTADVERYLSGVEYVTVPDVGDPDRQRLHRGGSPSTIPAEQGLWVASSVGRGDRAITWDVREGSWTVVVMNADASVGVDVRADVGATAPILDELAVGLFVVGGVLLLVGIAIVALVLRRVARSGAGRHER